MSLTDSFKREWYYNIWFPFIKKRISANNEGIYYVYKSPHLDFEHFITIYDANHVAHQCSSNLNIPIETIIKHKHLNWNWLSVSFRPDLTMTIIKENLDIPWESKLICLNGEIDFDTYMELYKTFKTQHYYYLSQNKNFIGLSQAVKRHTSKPWNWYEVTKNKNITMEDINSALHLKWNWDTVSMNPNLTLDFIRTHLEKLRMSPSFNSNVCENPNISIQIIFSNPSIFNCPIAISRNPNLVEQDVIDNSTFDWVYHYLFQHKNMSIEFLQKLPLYEGQIAEYSYSIMLNPNMSIKYVDENTKEGELNPLFKGKLGLLANKDYSNDRNSYVNEKTKQLLLANMYEVNSTQHTTEKCASINYILANEYLVSMMSKY